MSDEIIYAKPALWEHNLYVRLRNALFVARLSFRCAMKGHEWRRNRPTRCVRVTACQICGSFIGWSVEAEEDAGCRWYRPSRQRDLTPEEVDALRKSIVRGVTEGAKRRELGE